jgi:hypothetical protein
MPAATTHGPISAVVLMMELTGYAGAAILLMLLAVATATLAARLIEARLIYDARLSDAQVQERQSTRNRAPAKPGFEACSVQRLDMLNRTSEPTWKRSATGEDTVDMRRESQPLRG